jgi:hypothetical protein
MFRYVKRLGEMPRKRDLDPVLVNTLIQAAGDPVTAVDYLDAWFDSLDPWYEREGFGLEKLCGVSLSRLFAQGDIEPNGGMTERDHLARTLLVSLLLKPQLSLISGKKSSD